MPRSDSADSQSQAIQEEPLPSTSNEDEDPLAGKINCSPIYFILFYFIILRFLKQCCLMMFVMFLFQKASVCQRVWIHPSWQLFLKTSVERCCKISSASDHPLVLLWPPACLPLLRLYWEDQGLQRSALSSWQLCHLPSRRR